MAWLSVVWGTQGPAALLLQARVVEVEVVEEVEVTEVEVEVTEVEAVAVIQITPDDRYFIRRKRLIDDRYSSGG